MTRLRRWLGRIGIGLAVLAIIVGIALLARHELTRRVAGLPSFTHGAGERFDRMVAMSDGVKLLTKVALPDGVGPFPTVLVRSPYAQVDWLLRDYLCGRFIRYGYGCVYQDTRGQGGSEGSWDPGSDEIADGRDTLAWLAAQDFQDGNLAMVGSSYLASVQFAALAGGAPPELKTIVPAMYTTDNRGVMYQDGLFRHETYTAWASMMRGPDHSTDDAGAEYQAAVRHRPHDEVDTEIFGVAMPWYQEMIAATSPADDHWQREQSVRVRQVPETLAIPVLMVGGWYDVFFGPQFEDWRRLATQAESRYIIGPWTHTGSVGDLEMPNADGWTLQWAEMLPWLAHHLKGEPLRPPTGLRLYVIGDGDWQERKVWPAAALPQTLHLTNLEAAGGCEGGGLADAPGTREATHTATYTYDPDDPVPTRGGAGMLAYRFPGYGGAPPANVEQAGLCERDDILTFQGEPLDERLFLSGVIRVTLDVASSAPDTAFTAKLVEVFADGRAFNIRDSATTLAYRNGAETPQELHAGRTRLGLPRLLADRVAHAARITPPPGRLVLGLPQVPRPHQSRGRLGGADQRRSRAAGGVRREARASGGALAR